MYRSDEVSHPATSVWGDHDDRLDSCLLLRLLTVPVSRCHVYSCNVGISGTSNTNLAYFIYNAMVFWGICSVC